MVLDYFSCCCIGLFVCFVTACHCKITAYVGDNKLILILSFYISMLSIFVDVSVRNQEKNRTNFTESAAIFLALYGWF